VRVARTCRDGHDAGASSGAAATVAYPNTGMPAPRVCRPWSVRRSSRGPAGSPAARRMGRAAVLLAMLDELGKHESTKVWAVETGKLIKNLGPAIPRIRRRPA